MKMPWLVLPNWSAVIKADAPMRFHAAGQKFEVRSGGDNYFVHESIAFFPVLGVLIKGAGTGYGVTDQQDVTAMVEKARVDPGVSGAMLIVDSPGGTVSATAEMGDSLARFAASKPLVGYAQDLAASAGYWALSQSSKIFANRTAIVGSIGVITELVDASKLYEQMGVKIIPIVTGKFKAAGGDAEPITPEVIDYFQGNINSLFEHFVSAVNAGRGMSATKIKALEAAVFVGEQAVEKGLVDKIGTMDEALSALHRMVKSGKERGQKARALVDSM